MSAKSTVISHAAPAVRPRLRPGPVGDLQSAAKGSVKGTIGAFVTEKEPAPFPVVIVAALPLLLLCWLAPPAAGQAASDRHPDPVRRFYERLAQTADAEDRLDFLRQLIDETPAFARPYHALFETLTATRGPAAARAYFYQRKDRVMGLWMLARIHALADSAARALHAFAGAIRVDKGKDPRLLSEFVDYAHEQNALDQGTLRGLALQGPVRALLTVLVDAKLERHGRALEAAADLPAFLREHPIVTDVTGYGQYKLRQLGRAEATFRKGLSAAQVRGDVYYEALFRMRLAMVAFARRDFDAAGRAYAAARAAARRIHSLDLGSKIAGNRGGFHFSRGDYAQALEAYREAVAAAAGLGRRGEMAAWYYGLALTLRATQEFEGALRALDNARSHAKRSSRQNLLVQIHLEKGKLFTGLGLNLLAAREYENAYDLAKATGRMRGHRRAFGGIAAILLAEGKYEKARTILTDLIAAGAGRARAVDLIYWRFLIADSYMREERWDSALRHFDEVLTFSEEAGGDYVTYVRVSAMLSTAKIKMMTDAPDAAKILNADVLVSFAAQREDIALERNHMLGTLAARSGNFIEARRHYTLAMRQFEEQRSAIGVDQFRIGFFGKGAELVDDMIALVAAQYEKTKDPGLLTTLLVYLEENNARVLRELRYRARPLRGSPVDLAAYDRAGSRLRRLQKTMRRHPEGYPAVMEIHEALRYDLLSKRLKIAGDSTAAPDPVDPAAIQAYLRAADLNLVYYHFSANLALALTANGDAIQLTRLDTQQAQIRAWVDSLMAPLQAGHTAAQARAPYRAEIAYALYRRLFRPLENRLDPARGLIIVPDVTIMGLPFEMLLTEKAARPAYMPGDRADYVHSLLLKRYSMSYAPALAVAMTQAPRRRGDPRILVLANPMSDPVAASSGGPVSDNPIWPARPLWFSDLEADGIRDVHANTRVFKRRLATKAAFTREAADYDIIHLATHAFVDTAFDAFSGLVLAMSPDTLDDGLLMGHEIANLTLGNDLITLSACETGRGRTVAGEGLLGLPRVFLSAGARSVVMTLWRVDDKFSSLLMPRFYDYLINDNLTKAESLRRAKLDMLRYEGKADTHPYQHPLFWSAFTLHGDPGQTTGSFPVTDDWVAWLVLGVVVLAGTIFLHRRARS